MTDTTKTPRMAHITMRIPASTWKYFQQFDNPRVIMRDVLVAHQIKYDKDIDNVK